MEDLGEYVNGKYSIDNFKQTIEKSAYWGEANVDSILLQPIIMDNIKICLIISLFAIPQYFNKNIS